MLRVVLRSAHHRWARQTVLAASAVTVALIVLTACSQVLGFKDPTLEAPAAMLDAATDTATEIDAATTIGGTPIDASATLDATPLDAAIDAGIDATPACVPAACPFGCDMTTNACRDGNLWIFRTAAAFFGNEFGGGDAPPNVRGGADAKCLETYALVYSARGCSSNRVHAILHVNNTDSIPLMATKYGIPTAAPVNRAEDNVLISNNWNELTDSTRALRAPPTTATTDAAGLVWMGANTVSTCVNWTSAASTESGARGYGNHMEAGWFNEDTSRCDRAAGLLCICWADGQ